MDNIIGMYAALQKKDPLVFVKDHMHTCNQLINQCNEELKTCKDKEKLVEFQEEIKSYEDQLINLQSIIDRHNMGEIHNVTTITDVLTNINI